MPEDDTIRPFTVGFPEPELTDLRRRVNATRWPERRDGHRRLAGRAARDDAGSRAVLGDRLRLAQVRGEAERPAALHHRDRRARHPFHPRPLPARRCAAADRHARVARLGHRAAEDHRAAHQPRGARRERRGSVPPGDSLAARSRILRQADRHRLGSRPHRTGLGRADEAPRLHPVRGAGRRLGRGRHAGDGDTGRAGTARHPLQHAGYRSGRHQQGGPARRPAAAGSVGRGEPRVRAAEHLLRQAPGLRADHVDAPADAVRAGGLPRRPGRVHARPRRRHRPARARGKGPEGTAATAP